MNRSGTEIRHQIFIPVYTSPPEAALNDADHYAAAADAVPPFRKKPRKRADTVKGALYHEYDLRTHQFIAHIRRIYPLNKDIEMVLNKGITVVKAANPLAALGQPLYYIHSKPKCIMICFL